MRSVQDQAEMRRVLEERAREVGFDLVGVTDAEPLRKGGERLRKWQEAGMAADMGYMHRPVALLSDPKKLQKSARSVVSLGVSYYPGDHPENLEGEGRVARYAWGRDYHLVIKERLRELRAELEEALGGRIKARAFTDAVPLLERSAAQHAGLGGRHGALALGRAEGVPTKQKAQGLANQVTELLGGQPRRSDLKEKTGL